MAQTEPQENMEERGGPGGRRSAVWDHFVVSKDGTGKDIATCKQCKTSLCAETKMGTSHLKRHHCCKGQDGPPAKQRRRRTPAAPGHHIAESSEGSWSGQEECGAELARMITFHGYSSSMVDDECFRSFVSFLNPHFQMPSRAAVEAMCHDQAKDAMNQLMETMSCCSGQQISLATGTAEAGHGRALYMVCQFIDEEWALQKRIMQVFRVVRGLPIGHSVLQGAEEVCLDLTDRIHEQVSVPGTCSKLEEAVRRWGLQGRLFSVAWGEEIEKNLKRKDFLDSLCSFVHVGEGSIEIPVVLCVTYTSDVLNSVADTFVQALSGKYEDSCLKTLKDVSLSHEKRSQNFSELGLDHVGRYDKRWYNYYCALEVLHKEYSDNNEALREEPKLNRAQIMALLARCTPREMEVKVGHLIKPQKLKEDVFTDLLRKVLGTVYQAFKTISSPSSPTANLCFEELMKLRAVLQSEANDARTVVAKAVAYAKLGCFSLEKDADVVLREVQDMLDNHLMEAYLYLSIPAVLDPRFKLEYVTNALNEVFGSNAPEYISIVKKRIEGIFDEHKGKLLSSINGEGTSRMAAAIGAAAMDTDGSYSQEGITELEGYLTDGLVPREEGQGFDVLMWWKANSSRYPTVASMARDALAMPASDMLSPEHIARIRSMMSNCCITYP